MAVNSLLKLFSVTIFIQLFKDAYGWNKFCSVVCGNQSCNTNAYSDCSSSCSSPWTWTAANSSCDVLPTSGWAIVDIYNDVGGGGIGHNGSGTATCGPQNGGSQWSYSYIGNLTGSSIVRFTDSAGVQVPHYQIRIIFWTILIDSWGGGDTITAIL